MEKRTRWQFFVILIACILTVYNILPTIFYYAQPLSKPINEQKAQTIANNIVQRVNNLEDESLTWLNSFCNLLHVSAKRIEINKNNPQKITLEFFNEDEANLFAKHLPRAGALISFVPAQLNLGPRDDDNPNIVTVQRQIPIRLNNDKDVSPFVFSKKFNEENKPTNFYKSLVFDRAESLGLAIGGQSEASQQLAILENPNLDPTIKSQILSQICQNILSFSDVFEKNMTIAKRYFASLTQKDGVSEKAISTLQKAFQAERDSIKLQRIETEKEESLAKEEKEKQIKLLKRKEDLFAKAEKVIKDNKSSFISGQEPWNEKSIQSLLNQTYTPQEQVLQVGRNNPFISSIAIDWEKEKITLKLHEDLAKFEAQVASNKKDQYSQLIINEIARISRLCDEKISPIGSKFEINLATISDVQSFLSIDLQKVAQIEKSQLINELTDSFNPTYQDLSNENYPVYDFKEHKTLPGSKKSLGLVVYSPLEEESTIEGMRPNSIYIIGKGLKRIIDKYKGDPSSKEARNFFEDFTSLRTFLQSDGFVAYPGAALQHPEFANDIIFEKTDFCQSLLKATREDFQVKGTKKQAYLELSTVEQRILVQNKIDSKIHEDLLKWQDEYNQAQVSLDAYKKFDIPKPTRSVLWNNLLVSTKKYFRGDERKILHWGLDLTGGKEVQIELRDQNNQVVTSEAEINEGINELYNRVNKMGVSEVSIRREGNTIALDFPGSQAISAQELIKSSSMFFHVVNEKFSSNNRSLSDSTNRFLQEVWNEAVVTDKTDPENINLLAFKHLYGDSPEDGIVQPRSEAAQILYDSGLRLSLPQETIKSSTFDDSVSMLAVVRTEDNQKVQAHPLMIVFKNYALEGASLQNVRTSYDPSKGNFLSFEVKSSNTLPDGTIYSPSENFYAWTSVLSKDNVSNSPYGAFSNNRGWRMAVVLNDSVISAPSLESPLSSAASITGNFSQREAEMLSADLKAGSLTYTPKILSEKNISPELGTKEKSQGLFATFVALALVIGVMVGYYRFAGLVASIAVICNLLVLWAALQNMGATLSLAGIAGVILTVGMAVDANVLVFERIREEFEKSKQIGHAIKMGYQKAFTAIFDSNITTLMAGFILLNFDSGPVKGFAVTLIIGIISSMFTALFMTRYFFAGWAENPKNTALNMLHWIKDKKIDFLQKSKFVIGISLLLIVVGNFALVSQKNSMFGMDFTGGYALNVSIDSKEDNLKDMVQDALVSSGALNQDVGVRKLDQPNNLKIYLSSVMEQENKPFNGLPLSTKQSDVTYKHETNPRISWVVSALEKKGLTLTEKSKQELDIHWTAISGQMSDTMKSNAIWGLSLALLAILGYITFRFEFKYAFSAMLCLIHDVLVSLGIIALLHAMGVAVQIDLNTIAALMLIIGYSLNDTIVIFDRIREDLNLSRKSSLAEIVNHAINTTLSRTLLTSVTTFLVLFALVLFGGSSIFGFSLVMCLGVVFGTLSSIFIASPIMLYLHKKEEKQEVSVVSK